MDILEVSGLSLGFVLFALIAHFVLSATVGWLVYWLTSTILQHTSFVLKQKLGESGIYRYALSLALCFAVLVHILEDYTLYLF